MPKKIDRKRVRLYVVEHFDCEAVIETFVIAARDEAQALAKANDCSRAPQDGDRDYSPIVIHSEGGERMEIPYRQSAWLLIPDEWSPGEVVCAAPHTEA